MEKDKNNQTRTQSKINQLSLEFSNKPIVVSQNSNQTPSSENSRIISLSDYKIPDKGIIDYSNLVIKHTKSF